jgi:hypothetical protein
LPPINKTDQITLGLSLWLDEKWGSRHAHYTSISTIESIIGKQEIWFSNPLFMNDLQEMRFGIQEGMAMLMQSPNVIKCCATEARADLLKRHVTYYFNEFDNKHALDTYVFCLTDHDLLNPDGRLSMWRAYGGQGNGAALVFNTSFITFNADSPLIIAKVHYKSHSNRLAWLQDKLDTYLGITARLGLPDERLFIASYQIFNLINIFALIFKHDGFSEEQEWRAIYMPDRDIQQALTDKFSYHIGPRGVEPKLKFPVAPLKIADAGEWKFDDIVEQIILGPSVSSPLAVASIKRMLKTLRHPGLIDRVVASTIPLRASL